MTKKANLVGAFAATLALGASVSAAQALSVGFKLTLLQNPGTSYSAVNGDNPVFILENQSEGGLRITQIDFSIGNTAYNFDRVVLTGTTGGGVVRGGPAGGAMSIAGGSIDGIDGGIRADQFSLSFTDFDPTEKATWTAEIDQDAPPAANANNATNFRTVFFDNGGASVPNSVMKVHFSDLRALTYEITGVSQGQIGATVTSTCDLTGASAEISAIYALSDNSGVAASLTGVPLTAALRREARGLARSSSFTCTSSGGDIEVTITSDDGDWEWSLKD